MLCGKKSINFIKIRKNCWVRFGHKIYGSYAKGYVQLTFQQCNFDLIWFNFVNLLNTILIETVLKPNILIGLLQGIFEFIESLFLECLILPILGMLMYAENVINA